MLENYSEFISKLNKDKLNYSYEISETQLRKIKELIKSDKEQ